MLAKKTLAFHKIELNFHPKSRDMLCESPDSTFLHISVEVSFGATRFPLTHSSYIKTLHVLVPVWWTCSKSRKCMYASHFLTYATKNVLKQQLLLEFRIFNFCINIWGIILPVAPGNLPFPSTYVVHPMRLIDHMLMDFLWLLQIKHTRHGRPEARALCFLTLRISHSIPSKSSGVDIEQTWVNPSIHSGQLIINP